MQPIRSHQDLEVWQRAVELTVAVYSHTRCFPRHELWGLAGQMQRAAVSVPANIAEGHGRSHTKEYLQSLSHAYGSLMELQTHVIIAQRLEYLDNRAANSLLEHASRIAQMLNALMRALTPRTQSQPATP